MMVLRSLVRCLLAVSVALVAYEGCKASDPRTQNCTTKANSCVCTPGKPIACNCLNDTSSTSHTQTCGKDGRSASTECDCPVDESTQNGCHNGCRPTQTCVNEQCVNDSTTPTGGGGKDSGGGTSGASCPSAVTLGTTADTQQGDTTQGKASTTATCGKKGNVYAFQASDDGKATVTAASSTPTLDLMLSVSSNCSDAGDAVSCSDLAGPGGMETLTFSLKSGSTYYVFVNAKDGQDGAYSLETKFLSDASCTSPDCDPTARATCGHSITVIGAGLPANCDARPNSCLPGFCQTFASCCVADAYGFGWDSNCVSNASRFCVNNKQ